MRSTQIRETFFEFFTARGHHRVASSPLIPTDATLLLANAGMNQFKPYFLGETPPPFPRAVSVQKCARTSDIDNVGRTTRHATFFEMLGNFSFGDYFKTDAIGFAWELLTAGYGLDPDRLWITVFHDDEEADALWRAIGVPPARIQRLGMADNYWSMGVPGPCGPCSEICYDRGPAFGVEGGPDSNGERYLEIWNLVFMQNTRGEGDGKGDFPILGELPAKSVDTGLGLDRLALILQNADTVCQTDLLAPTLHTVETLAGRPFPGRDGTEESVSFQVVTEHARSAAFLIADGVLPSNEGRGYVLRRLMRRAIRHARLLGIDDQVLPAVTGSVVANLGGVWPELVDQHSLITQVVAAEEDSFSRALRTGSRLLDAAVSHARDTHSSQLAADTAFELHDTFGFPIELTIEAAREAGLTVDEDRFATLLAAQQRQAKAGGKAKTGQALALLDAYRQIAATHNRTQFVGYDQLAVEARILGLIADGSVVQAAEPGSQVQVVLDRSPFYAESGGQVGDTGTIHTATGAVLQITDTRLGLEGFHVHTARVTTGQIHTGETGEAVVDRAHRSAVARSHSATHVLHAMLRRTLGDHAKQQGSLVAAGRLRFDFAHFSPIDPTALAAVQTLVNDHLLDDPDVRVWQATRAQAEAAGATALFGEKYGDTVRIVDIGDFSRELCGGTHVGHGAAAGPVHILGESSIGASLRRIEALTGPDALRFYDHERALLAELADLLGTRPEDAPAQLRKRLDTLAAAQHQLHRLRHAELAQTARELAGAGQQIGGGWLVATRLAEVSAEELRQVATAILEHRRGQPTIVILAAEIDTNANLVAAISPDLHERGLQAPQLLQTAGKAIGGGAGGKGNLAFAGGKQITQLDHALQLAIQTGRAHLLS